MTWSILEALEKSSIFLNQIILKHSMEGFIKKL